jgi:hypothetical protein
VLGGIGSSDGVVWGGGEVLRVGWASSFLGRFGVGFDGVLVDGLKNASRVRFAIVAWNWEVIVKLRTETRRDMERAGDVILRSGFDLYNFPIWLGVTNLDFVQVRIYQ